MPTTVSDVELAWIVEGVICMAVLCAVWGISFLWLYAVLTNNRDDWTRRRAWQQFRIKTLLLLIQGVFLWVGFLAAQTPEPIRETNQDAARTSAIVSLAFQAVIVVFAVWDFVDWRWLLEPRRKKP